MPVGTEVDLGPGDIMLDGNPALPSKRGDSTSEFWPMYCGHTAAWIKMLLGTAVELGPSHIVLDGAKQPPVFSAHVYCDHTVHHLSYC